MRKTLWTVLTAASVLVPAALEAQAKMLVVRTLRRSDRIISDTMGTPFQVSAPAARVFSALEEVYADLKVDAPLRDSMMLEIGNEKFFQRNNFAGRRISSFMECGGGLTGPYADNHRVDLSLVTFVRPVDANQTTIRTVLLGAAINVTEGVKPTQHCQSNGELERMIHQRVIKKLM